MSFYYKGKRIKKVGIFGLGKSNLGVISYLKSKYPDITYTLRSDGNIPEKSAMRVTKFDRILIGKAASDVPFEDLVFLSPSVRRERFGKRCENVFTSDAELFFLHTKREILTVSGSDGKSTTATLSHLMLKHSGIKSCCIGNVGEAMTPHTDENFPAVVELSSFQLKYLDCSFGRSVLTNVTPNHLDWHKSFEDYLDAKMRLVNNSKEIILNADDKVCAHIAKSISPFAVFSLKKSEEEIKTLANAELYGYMKEGFLCVNGVRILNTGAIISKNKYNIANFLAAILLTYGKVNHNGILHTANSFETLRHRCEVVGNFDGITYIDSSIDSTPMRSSATLSSLGQRVIIILGGRSKGLDYSTLIPELIKYAKAVVITGECGKLIYDTLFDNPDYTKKSIPTHFISGFEDAVLRSIDIAERGDTVLLSPASTSYDSFKNFEERGNKFKEIITKHYRGL